MENKKYLTVKEVAEYLAETPYTIREYCKQGKLEFFKPDKRIYITLESVHRYIESGKVNPKSKNDK